MNTYQELKYKVFNSGSKVNLFIGINVIIFLVLSLINLIQFLFFRQSGFQNLTYEWLGVPANPENLLYRFWTPITYMFVHNGLLHILFNMLWLFWMGRIFESFQSAKKITFLYLFGGLAGAFLYILAYNTIPAFQQNSFNAIAVGASAAVSAIVIATATLLPNYSIHLLLFGAVRLKWIALIYIALDILSLTGGNAGGHVAHLGGALFGFLFIKSYQNGKDWSLPFERLVQPKKKLKVVSRNFNTDSSTPEEPDQDTIDAILDKISQSGYESLTKKEKNILFKASKGHEEK